MTKRKKVRERMFNKIRQFEQSGLTKSDFCAKHQISQSHLHYWLKIYQSATLVQEAAPSFIPVVIDDIIPVTDNDGLLSQGKVAYRFLFLRKQLRFHSSVNCWRVEYVAHLSRYEVLLVSGSDGFSEGFCRS
jgi:hypothetical protein